MKKYIYNTALFTVIFAFVLNVTACKDEYMFFDEEFASMQFAGSGSTNDSVVFSFALRPGVDVEKVKIPLRLIGFTSEQEREVSVRVDQSKTTAKEGVDYSIEKCVLPAREIYADLEIIVKRSVELENEDLVLSIFLEENEYFKKPPVESGDFKIVLTSELSKPSDWKNEFGPYSVVKHEFIIKVTNKGTDYYEWSGQLLIYYLGMLNQALYEYNKEHPGEPLTDEFGVLVTF